MPRNDDAPLRGVDYEGLTHAQRSTLVHQFEAGLRLLDEKCRLYQYLLKRTIEPIVAAPCAQPIAHEALRGWLSTRQAVAVLESELNRAIATLHHKAHAFEVQLSDFGPRRLTKPEAFRFFRSLVNYDASTAAAARLTHDTHLDYFVADSAIECHRDHLVVGRQRVKVMSMKEPPSQTFAHLLGDLYAVPGEFIGCLEWQRISGDRMRRDLQSRRRHFFNKRVSMVTYVAPEARPEETRRSARGAAPRPRRSGASSTRLTVSWCSTSARTARLVPPEAYRRWRADIRARDEWRERETAAQIALHAQKKQAVAEWVAQHGTPEQQARQAAGVLPMEEVIDAMADQVFDAGNK